MSSYFINNTSGTMELIVNPGELNGAGGKVHSTDLRLYGMGAIKWGEGIDENFVRLLESFSCPQKEDDDEWFGGKTYDAATDRAWPKGQNDQVVEVTNPDNTSEKVTSYSPGPGMGITKPINGQLWFNNSQKLLYIYNEFNKGLDTVSGAPIIDGTLGTWEVVSGKVDLGSSPPVGPDPGDLWFKSGVGAVCGESQLMVQDAQHPDADADGWVSVSANYLKKCGDTMTGDLNMGTNNIVNVGDPVDDFDGSNKRFVENNYVNKSRLDGDTMSGPLFLIEGDTVETQTTRVLNQAKSDARYLKKAGDEAEGWLKLWKDHTPDITNSTFDWHAVPVGLLRSYVDGATGTFGKGAIYYGNAVIDASVGGGVYSTFDFSGSWKADYESKIGSAVDDADFLVVAIPTFEQIRVPNPRPVWKKNLTSVTDTAGSIGEYGLVDYNSGPGIDANSNPSFYPDVNSFCKVQVKTGPTAQKVRAPQRTTNYSTNGNAKVRIHFFGGPKDILWNFDPSATIEKI